MNPFKAFIATLFRKDDTVLKSESIYSISINGIDNTIINLENYKGKYILFVNVASKCGFTSQYKALEELYKKYKNKLVVIGLPCNQFANQEPGSADTIAEFCSINYGVTFPITEKVKVKGNNQHPIYRWLTKKMINGKYNTRVKWNFQKYLVSPNGELIDYYYSTTSPLSSKLTKYLK